MGPFSKPRFKVQVNALNRSRPGISSHFSLPLNALCRGMQVMHRTGYVITDVKPVAADQKLEPSASNDAGTALEAGKTLIGKLSGINKESSNEKKPSQGQSPKSSDSTDEGTPPKGGNALINKLTRKDKENSSKQKPSQRKRQRKR